MLRYHYKNFYLLRHFFSQRMHFRRHRRISPDETLIRWPKWKNEYVFFSKYMPTTNRTYADANLRMQKLI